MPEQHKPHQPWTNPEYRAYLLSPDSVDSTKRDEVIEMENEPEYQAAIARAKVIRESVVEKLGVQQSSDQSGDCLSNAVARAVRTLEYLHEYNRRNLLWSREVNMLTALDFAQCLKYKNCSSPRVFSRVCYKIERLIAKLDLDADERRKSKRFVRKIPFLMEFRDSLSNLFLDVRKCYHLSKH